MSLPTIETVPSREVEVSCSRLEQVPSLALQKIVDQADCGVVTRLLRSSKALNTRICAETQKRLYPMDTQHGLFFPCKWERE